MARADTSTVCRWGCGGPGVVVGSVVVAMRASKIRDRVVGALEDAGHDLIAVQPNLAFDMLRRLDRIGAAPGVLVVDHDDHPASAPLLSRLRLAAMNIPTVGFTSQIAELHHGIRVALPRSIDDDRFVHVVEDLLDT